MASPIMGDCSFVEPLMRWWRATGPRDYPWRRADSLYEVLVAEILLQRTRRDKVVEVYHRFLERFPTPEVLAGASDSEVEEVIKPLGLAKRAPYLKRLGAALTRIRDSRKTRLERLPGVGPYVASAARLILGIDTRLKADSSIARVLSRYFGLGTEKRPGDTPWVNEVLNRCAPKDLQGRKEYFLAIVDLAWEVCTPRNPRCDLCPLKLRCSYAKTKSG